MDTVENKYEEMSDEEFLKLNEPGEPEQTEDTSENQVEETTGETEDQGTADDAGQEDTDKTENSDQTDDDDNASDSTDGEEAASETDAGDTEQTDESETKSDPMAGDGEEAKQETDEKSPETDKQSETDSKEEGKDKSDDKSEQLQLTLPEGVTVEQVNSALSFYEQVSKPFKADGRDITVRNAEDAIRLMQQGANYSRRMQELKPIKHIHRMLQDHGLADTSKLNFAIDLIKGDKTAITKLLKDHNIDSMDLDTNSEVSYQGNNYAGNAQANAFRDELENVMAQPNGKALVTDIHSNWDDASKNKLQEDPSILGNLNQMYSSGVYKRIVDEIAYQRTVGGIADGTPFLEAYDRVGKAMNDAGAFDDINKKTEEPGLQIRQQPIASGTRKAATAPKKPAPNPHLSSAPASKSSSPAQQKPEFNALSDEDFLKMPPPK